MSANNKDDKFLYDKDDFRNGGMHDEVVHFTDKKTLKLINKIKQRNRREQAEKLKEKIKLVQKIAEIKKDGRYYC